LTCSSRRSQQLRIIMEVLIRLCVSSEGTQKRPPRPITDFNGKELDGRALTVNEANPVKSVLVATSAVGGGGRGGKREFSRR